MKIFYTKTTQKEVKKVKLDVITIPQEDRDAISFACKEENAALVFTTRASNNENDVPEFIVLARNLDSRFTGNEYIFWKYNPREKKLHSGEYLLDSANSIKTFANLIHITD